MGTNYYWRKDECPKCHRGSEEIHIGKSSCGWKFLFNFNDSTYYYDYPSLLGWLKGKTIYNEYGETISLKEFKKMIASKQNASEKHESSYCICIDGYDFMNAEFC